MQFDRLYSQKVQCDSVSRYLKGSAVTGLVMLALYSTLLREGKRALRVF